MTTLKQLMEMWLTNSNGEFYIVLEMNLDIVNTAKLLPCRVHDALGVMNYNQIRQHTEMRDNLQSRHQDITNDVNQCK